MTNSVLTYTNEYRGRALLLFLLFGLAIYQFVNAGFSAFVMVCMLPFTQTKSPGKKNVTTAVSMMNRLALALNMSLSFLSITTIVSLCVIVEVCGIVTVETGGAEGTMLH